MIEGDTTMKGIVLAVSLITLMSASALHADELGVGSKAPGFNLVNAADGNKVNFKPGDGKTSVVIFTCNDCPFAKAFEDRIVSIARQYSSKGVAFYALNPNDDNTHPGETLAIMKSRAAAKNYSLPYLKDGDSAIARAYGARVTPHVFVIDGSGVVKYHGYVDDSAKPDQRTDEGLINALDSMLAGKQIKNASTRAFGCTIKWKSKA